MADLKWLDYSGQSLEEILRLEGEYRVDSLVTGCEEAINNKEARDGVQSLTPEERVVQAIEALEREVNNGGYEQFFINSSNEHAQGIVDALEQIGCPKSAEITRRAIAAIGASNLNQESIDAVMSEENKKREEEFNECDQLFYASAEDIATHLFAFIRSNAEKITF